MPKLDGGEMRVQGNLHAAHGAMPFGGMPLPPDYGEIRRIVEAHFRIEDAWVEEGSARFLVSSSNVKGSFLGAERGLAGLGYMPFLRSRGDRLLMVVVPRPSLPPSKPIWNLLLFLLTIGTTAYAGYEMSLVLVRNGLGIDPVQGALSFSAALLSILGLHELGHKFIANRRGVESTLPYFIPFPSFIGTFGAIIRTKVPAPNKDALFDLGAAGPIAGFLALVPAAAIGLKLSYIVEVSRIPPGTIPLSPPLMFRLMTHLMGIPTEGTTVILLHPVAFASWVGMLVTTLNLMPVGMLDGGHIARAIFGDRSHRILSILGAMLTLALGWWFMAIFMIYFSFVRHIGPLDDVSELTVWRKILSLLIVGMAILCMAPAPGISLQWLLRALERLLATWSI
ncbi:MAG: site-2 protease family protein [Candidatus Bathyarchaeia archaeon]